jgi:hypothetical protein
MDSRREKDVVVFAEPPIVVDDDDESVSAPVTAFASRAVLEEVAYATALLFVVVVLRPSPPNLEESGLTFSRMSFPVFALTIVAESPSKRYTTGSRSTSPDVRVGVDGGASADNASETVALERTSRTVTAPARRDEGCAVADSDRKGAVEAIRERERRVVRAFVAGRDGVTTAHGTTRDADIMVRERAAEERTRNVREDLSVGTRADGLREC